MQEPISPGPIDIKPTGSTNEALHNKPLQILGMTNKAGLLSIGSEAVKSSARAGKIKLVILASDASKNAIRQAQYSAEDCDAISINTPYTKFELGSITGRGSPGTIAFLDIGLAANFVEKLAEIDKDKYEETAQTLKTQAKATGKRKIKGGVRI
jgi:ribosomal protein L7Ae-like RNA K-turn-binding protein